MRLFLDANILVSLLNKEYPLYVNTSRIVSLTDNSNFTIYTTPVCLAIAFYYAEKKSGSKLAKQKIALLASKIVIANVGKQETLNSLNDKRDNDFEDGLQYYTALQNKCSVIITEDIHDFYFSDIEVLKAADFLKKYLL